MWVSGDRFRLLVVGTAAVAALGLTTTACTADREGGVVNAAGNVTPSQPPTGGSLPPLAADTGIAVLEALDGTVLAAWVDAVIAVAPDAEPCVGGPPAMDAAIFDEAAALADPVLAELLLNADASFVSAHAACESGETEAAAAEWADALATTEFVRQRLHQAGHRW